MKPDAEPSSPPSPDVILAVTEGPRSGLRFRAGGRKAISLGRSKTTDFHILDTTMSRVHAIVSLDTDGWYVEDQKSRNGVWIGDERVTRAKLEDGAVFRLGRQTVVRFVVAQPQDRESGMIEISLRCVKCREPIVPESSAVRGADGRPYHIDCRNLDHLVGTELGEFKVTEKMKPLGDAFFFRAHQPTLNRSVVLEVFDTPLIARRGFKKALLGEVRRASRFLHPNILQISDFAEARGMCFVVMEHFRGEPLDQVLERQRFVKIRGAVAVATRMLEALRYAAEQGSVLSWIGPGRVLVSDVHEVKVKLFREPSHRKQSGPPPEDLAYTAPEVLQKKTSPTGEAACVYSVCAILYHMLAGIAPFEGATPAEVTRRVLHESPPALRRINLKVSPALAKVVEAGIDRDPGARPATLGELLSQIQKVSGSR